MRGPISCIMWVTHCNENYETLCYSTGLGYMVFWRQNPRDVSAQKIGRSIWFNSSSELL